MVTFIIPAYNAEKSIAECLESVLVQDCEKEIIVVDNNSNDNTANIVKRYPVKYLIETKKGPASAKNAGLRAKSTESKYIAFVDSDVVLPKGWCNKAIKLLQNEVLVVGTGGPGKNYGIDKIGRVFDYLLFGKTTKVKQQFVKSIATMDVCYKADAISGLCFEESLRAGEDPEFNFRLIEQGKKLIYSSELWVYHVYPKSLYKIIEKSFIYGHYFILPYLKHPKQVTLGLIARVMYIPILALLLLLSFYSLLFFLGALILIIIIPFVYGLLGLRLIQKNELKFIFVFAYVHALRQLAQMLGIWFGFLKEQKR